MRRTILGLVPNAAGEPITSTYKRNFAIDAERTEYLDGETIYHGTAAGYVDTTKTEVHISASQKTIDTERIEARKQVTTEFYADPEAGFIGVDSSDGEFLWEELSIRKGFYIERAEIDLDSWARDLADRRSANCWQIGWSHDDGDVQDVGSAFHEGASFDEAVRGGLTQLGFSYLWDGHGVVRGTAAASGYVAVFSTMSVPVFGRWLRDEILPHTALPEDEEETSGQTTLDESDEGASA